MVHHDTSTVSDAERELERLYRRMLPTVYRFATARLGRSDGEEVTADVFHAAAIAFVDGRRTQVTDAWLMAVTKNKVIDRWRKAERRGALAHLVRPRREDLVDFPDHWSAATQRDDVLDALDRLSSRHRALLIAHYVDGIPIPELAGHLDMSVAAVESAMARARRAFKHHFDPDQREGI